MKLRICLLAQLLIAGLGVAQVLATTITYSEVGLYAQTYTAAPIDSNNYDDQLFTTRPSGSVSATSHNQLASGDWQMTITGNTASALFDNLNLSLGPAPKFSWATIAGGCMFYTDTTISYSITGLFDTIGEPSAFVSWVLYDYGADRYKYFEDEHSVTKENPSFAPNLALDGDNWQSALIGNSQGTIGPGRYAFSFNYTFRSISTDSVANTNPAVESFARLDLGGGADQVPEPASLVLWSGLGAMGLIAARRRKRAA